MCHYHPPTAQSKVAAITALGFVLLSDGTAWWSLNLLSGPASKTKIKGFL
jgi:hypothetical protein